MPFDVKVAFGKNPHLNISEIEIGLGAYAVHEGNCSHLGDFGSRNYHLWFENLGRETALMVVDRFFGFRDHGLSSIATFPVDEETARKRERAYLEAKALAGQVEKPQQLRPRIWEYMLTSLNVPQAEQLSFAQSMSSFYRREDELAKAHPGETVVMEGERVIYHNPDGDDVSRWVQQNRHRKPVYVGKVD